MEKTICTERLDTFIRKVIRTHHATFDRSITAIPEIEGEVQVYRFAVRTVNFTLITNVNERTRESSVRLYKGVYPALCPDAQHPLLTITYPISEKEEISVNAQLPSSEDHDFAIMLSLIEQLKEIVSPCTRN